MKEALRKLLLPAVAAAGLMAGGFSAQAESVLHRGNGAEPETLDPAKSTGVIESNIQYELLEGLTTYAENGDVAPGVATKWDISDDGLTYTFHLRDEKWSNGDPVTANDFVYSFQRLLDPKTASDYAPIADVIAGAAEVRKTAPDKTPDFSKLGVKATDDHTLVVTLNKPTPYLVSMLRHSSFLPVNKAAVEKFGADWTKPGNFVGNGAFTLSEWTPQSSLTVVKNPNFYDAANVKLDKIIYYPTEDIGEEFKRYRAGELDITYEVPSDQIKFIESKLKDEYEAKPYLGTYYYVINLTREPLGKQKALREALALAIDRDTLAEKVTQGSFLPGWSWVPPGTGDYQNTYVSFKDMKQADRVKKAKELLKAAGYGPDKPLKIELLYNTSENHKKIAIAVQSMWKQVGVDATLNNQEWQVYLDTRDNKAYDVARAAWIGDYADPMSFLDIFLSDAGVRNDAGYNNPKYDELVKKSAGISDPKERMQVLQDAEKVFLDDLPLIPLLYYKTKHMVSKRVAGWTYNNLDFHLGRYMSVSAN
ncbi:peptide ABC transporter substrate-binding protein [Dongia sedimenti]|uniref:Peptide ABC transporter substrate-binding protein n=1 Tax=Dongia sedimenti TaxID=3064282 RepID=A0ABU0YJ93_9PROT|nr:peptide ABC transporter substrate-binding protein [Rhodospirillaceae bacterium R-7]